MSRPRARYCAHGHYIITHSEDEARFTTSDLQDEFDRLSKAVA